MFYSELLKFDQTLKGDETPSCSSIFIHPELSDILPHIWWKWKLWNRTQVNQGRGIKLLGGELFNINKSAILYYTFVGISWDRLRIFLDASQTYWLWEVLDGTNILLNFQPLAHPWLLPWGAGCPCDRVRPWKVLTVVKIIGYGKYDFEEGNNYGNRRNINCWHQVRVPRVWPQLGHNSCHPLCCKTAHRFPQKYKDKNTVWTRSLPLYIQSGL